MSLRGRAAERRRRRTERFPLIIERTNKDGIAAVFTSFTFIAL